MTAQPHELDHSEANYFETAIPRRGPIRRAFNRVVWIGWNVASIVFDGKVREARDRALWNDLEGAVEFSCKNHKAIGKMMQEMLKHSPGRLT